MTVEQLGQTLQPFSVQADILCLPQHLQCFDVICSHSPILSPQLTARLYPGLQVDLPVLPVLILALGPQPGEVEGGAGVFELYSVI